jgi:glycosyltransferase involved in cell wall biosynthesis
MKYSICIPSYNQQEYLPDAIESALAQTVPAYEIIVCDDGSTDHSLDIAKSYESRGVKVISQVNKGLSSARNTLIMNMTGDYFIPLDADDILQENYIEKVDAVIQKTNVDIVAPSFRCFGVSNADIVLDPNVRLENFRDANYIGYFSTVRKSKLLEIGGYSPRMIWGYEDYALWIDLLSHGATLAVLKDILVLYRTKEVSMIQTAQAHHQELMAQIMKDFPKIYE